MIKIYNTLTRKVEDFIPLQEKKVSIYACGVTTYDEVHVGHARQAIFFDIVRNYFEYLGFEVTYVRNYTDVDDKIINRANKEKKESSEISEYYIKEALEDFKKLKINTGTHEPKVTECMDDIIKYIEDLIRSGNAYEANGEVFFNVESFAEYGKLSNRNQKDMLSEEVSANKKNSNDFALWKPAKEGEPSWPSPWGNGRPGWHIECSVMAYKYLGKTIDIHGGGIDLLFPHHENEIAQSESHNMKPFVKYWMHNGLVTVNGVKMSKSLGNFVTVKDALEDNYPEEIRYSILIQSYSSEIDFTRELFAVARKRMYYFYKTLYKIDELIKDNNGIASIKDMPVIIEKFEENFIEAMNDNFNTAKVFANISEVFNQLNEIIVSDTMPKEQKISIFIYFKEKLSKIAHVLRVLEENPADYINKLEEYQLAKNKITKEYILSKIEKRRALKVNKQYVEADKIRDELLEKNITLKDSGEDVEWELVI